MSTLEDNQEAMVRKAFSSRPAGKEKNRRQPPKKREAPKRKILFRYSVPRMLLPRKPGIPEDFRMTETETAVPSTGAPGNRASPGSGKRKGKSSFSGARRGPRPEPGEAPDSSAGNQPENRESRPQAAPSGSGERQNRQGDRGQGSALSATAREEAGQIPGRPSGRQKPGQPSLRWTAREEAGDRSQEAVRETEARAAVLLATVRTVRETVPVFRDVRTAEAMTAEEGLTAGAEVQKRSGEKAPGGYGYRPEKALQRGQQL